ncbi:MAG: aminoacyl-tRNA hydrolase [Candidatus Rokubacteria bacterium]|nr:aminoacyl-tRNA hydrolase [Candidatus Rokubacteria bacterium]
MKLVVGLGNPGPRYAGTRHNVGFRVVERFARELRIPLEERRFGGRFGRASVGLGGGVRLDVGVLEPESFMNRSGEVVREALRLLPVDEVPRDLLVVLDDVDLPFGRLRLRPTGGSGGHLGLTDVIACLGRDDFPRLRFGVGRPGIPIETSSWVLQRFSPEEEERLAPRIEAAAAAVEAALAEGVEAAMNHVNQDPAGVAQ